MIRPSWDPSVERRLDQSGIGNGPGRRERIRGVAAFNRDADQFRRPSVLTTMVESSSITLSNRSEP